jgi:hypothetical protein
MVASTCTWNHIISDKFKTEPVFRLYISFKIVSLFSSLILPATANVLKTFQEANGRNLFGSFIAFLIILLVSQKRRQFNGEFSGGNRYKLPEANSREYGDAAALSHCSLLRNL